MMKVALLGAPGSGKTAVAKAMIRRLGDQWVAVDDYVERLNKETGLLFGPQAPYDMQMMVVTERWKQEFKQENRSHHVISCGSIYESIIYTATRGLTMVNNEIQMMDENIYSKSVMYALGAFEHQCFDYDALFYLPLQDRSEDELHSWEGVIDQKIPEVLSAHAKYAVTLNGSTKARAKRATDIIADFKAFAKIE